MSTNRHVVWSQAEYNAVLQAGHELFQKSPQQWKYLWPKAQIVLPEDRRRKLTSSSDISKMTHRYHEKLNNGGFEEPKEKAPAQVAQPVELAEPEPQIVYVERVVKEEPDYGHIPTSTLARLLLERLANLEMFETKLRELRDTQSAMASQNHSQAVRVFGPKVAPEVPKLAAKRVAVVGLLPDQYQEIERQAKEQWGDRLHLRFLDKDKNRGGQWPIVDYAIVTRHITHGTCEAAKDAVGGPARVFFVTSGQVMQKLFDIMSRQ